jgi:hypothetical protein
VRAYATMLLAATLVGAFAAETSAQVIKPRNPPPSSGRLPAPAKVSASQQPDGKIRVVWSSVDNATKYVLIRSVPPVPAAAVALPNPSDTLYVDSDVKPGSYYYYVVNADNEERVGGMKASAPPVRAAGEVAGLRAPSDTVATPDSSQSPEALPPPTNVVASPYPYLQAMLNWQSSTPGVLFLVERRTKRNSKENTWERLRGPTEDMWRCCGARDGYPPIGKYFEYRVTAVQAEPPNLRSLPALSNTIIGERIRTDTSVVDAMGLVVGQTASVQPVGLSQIRWVSLNPWIASVERAGYVSAQHPGQAFVVATGLTPQGAIQSWVWRIQVDPKP